MFITIAFDPQYKPYEIFVRLGKSGGCASAIMNGISVLSSYALREGLDPQKVVKAFTGIQCHGSRNTCLSEISKVIKLHMSKTTTKIKELKQSGSATGLNNEIN